MNRVPLRAPYGPRGASVERIAFDELAHGGRAARRLGSGAWTVALLYGRMALESGGAPERLDATLEVDRLPLALVEEHGEVVQLPTAETFLGESDLEDLREQGLASARSVRGSDTALVGPVRALDGDVLRRS